MENASAPRALLGDRNRVFLLVSNIYPAILGTMIWELISRMPTDPIAWIATFVIVSHFTLDLLYLKLNLDFYNAEDAFRYGWLMFLVDVAIVGLIRLAFGTIPELVEPHSKVVNPITSFAGIYILYVIWEYLYYWINPAEKRSPDSSTTHYWYLAAWFALCAGMYSAGIGTSLPHWVPTATVIGFLAGVAVACAELYWSVFLAVNDRKAAGASAPAAPSEPAAAGEDVGPEEGGGPMTATVQFTADPVERPLAHRTVTVELHGLWAMPDAKAQISSAVAWRDANDARQLLVTLLVRDESGLSEVEHLVRHIGAIAAAHRDRPAIRVYCLVPSSVEDMIGQLAKADTQTPRIELVRVVDQPLQPGRLAQLAKEAVAAEASSLQFWPYLELSSVDELEQLSDLLPESAADPAYQPAVRRFPVVEVAGSFEIGDADAIADFWSRHPDVQSASTRSLHGRLKTFFALFELARLAHIGVELPASAVEREQLAGFQGWLRRRGLLTSEPYVQNAILEHDVDLLSDSHECQSPVFSFAALARGLNATQAMGDHP